MGLLGCSLLSGIMGAHLPGEGSVFLWQDISFKVQLRNGGAMHAVPPTCA
jgi:hypothetical protein